MASTFQAKCRVIVLESVADNILQRTRCKTDLINYNFRSRDTATQSDVMRNRAPSRIRVGPDGEWHSISFSEDRHARVLCHDGLKRFGLFVPVWCIDSRDTVSHPSLVLCLHHQVLVT